MWRFVSFHIRLIIYYLFLFALLRIVFLVDAHKYFDTAPLSEILYCFRSALKLDLATVAYFISPSLLLILIACISRKAWMNKVIDYFHLAVTMLYAGLAVSEVLLYREWQAKIGYDSLKHFANLSEVIKTPSLSMVLYFTIGTGIVFFLFRWLYRKFVATDLRFQEYRRSVTFYLAVALIFLASAALSVITMRGGLNRFPIGMGVAYYSSKSTLNDGATNVLWHTIYSLLHTSEYDRLQPFIDNNPAADDFFDLYQAPPDTFPSILSTRQPNIVFLILESWSADVCLTKGRDSLIAPYFNRMIGDGLYFSNCYAIGHVSDQGVPASLGALPVIPAFSMLTGKQQVGELPCITDELKSRNYFSGFLYGGQLDYGNIRGYVFKKGFDEVMDVQHFPAGTEKTALGVPDLPLYRQLLANINQARSPFFYCGYNISTHSPYDVPVDYKLGVGGVNAPFINTIHYGDSSLHVFFEEAKKMPWYANTLFVLVADHSHESQIIRVKEDKDRYKIPLLLYGPALKPDYRGKIEEKIISQLDVTGLLLSQLGFDYRKRYPFTRNPLQPNHREIAFYNYPGGSGIVVPGAFVTRDINNKNEKAGLLGDTTRLRLYNDIEKYLNKAARYLREQ